MSNEDRKQKICEDLALLKVFKVMCQHDLGNLSNAQIYGIYQDNYDPAEFEHCVNNGICEDL